MKLGAERNKILIVVGLLGVAAYQFISNMGPSAGPAAQSQSKVSLPVAGGQATVKNVSASPVDALRAAKRQKRQPGLRSGTAEFRPSLKPARPEDRPDPMTIDPTLRLELLDKLQNVKFGGGTRSLFEIGQPPPKPAEKIEVATVVRRWDHPQPPPPPPTPTPTPAPPPIPLKFYGFVNARSPSSPKRAFFLEGEEIHIAGEGELIKKRYKVIRIGVNSVVVEDTEHKHQQTLPLEEQAS